MKRAHSAPEARKEGLIVHPLSEEVLVYDSDRHKAHCLNKTAALVWNRCDGKTSVAELAQGLGDEIKAPVDQDVIWLALDQLAKARLLHEDTPAARKPGLSRRELMKRIGVGGAMALPLITSIIAPTVAQAGTTCSAVVCAGGICPVGCTCVSPGSPCV